MATKIQLSLKLILFFLDKWQEQTHYYPDLNFTPKLVHMLNFKDLGISIKDLGNSLGH